MELQISNRGARRHFAVCAACRPEAFGAHSPTRVLSLSVCRAIIEYCAVRHLLRCRWQINKIERDFWQLQSMACVAEPRASAGNNNFVICFICRARLRACFYAGSWDYLRIFRPPPWLRRHQRAHKWGAGESESSTWLIGFAGAS